MVSGVASGRLGSATARAPVASAAFSWASPSALAALLMLVLGIAGCAHTTIGPQVASPSPPPRDDLRIAGQVVADTSQSSGPSLCTMSGRSSQLDFYSERMPAAPSPLEISVAIHLKGVSDQQSYTASEPATGNAGTVVSLNIRQPSQTSGALVPIPAKAGTVRVAGLDWQSRKAWGSVTAEFLNGARVNGTWLCQASGT